MIVCGAFNQNMTWLEFLWCDFNRHKLGGVVGSNIALTSIKFAASPSRLNLPPRAYQS
jgi:hypothetical protein